MANSTIKYIWCTLLLLLLSFTAPVVYSQSTEVVHISSVADSGNMLFRIEKAAAVGDSYPDSAQQLLNDLFIQSAHIGFVRGMKSALEESMTLQLKVHNHRRVIVLADRLIKLSDPNRDQALLFESYENKAGSLFLTNQYYPASNAYTMALKFVPKAKAKEKARIYSNIGSIFQLLKLSDKATAFYNMAITAGLQYGDFGIVSRAYAGKGYIARTELDYKESAKCIDSAIWFAHRYQLQDSKQFALVYKADLLNHQKKFKEALVELDQAQKIYDEYPELITNPYRLTSIKGDTYLFSQEFNKAKEAYHKALQLVGEDQNGRIYLLHRLSHAYASTHDFKKAYDLHCQSHNLSDSLVRQEASEKANELEVRYRVAEKDKEIAWKNLQIIKAQKNLAQKNLFIVSFLLGTLILLIVIFSLYRSYRKKKKLAEKESEIAQLRALMEGEEKERKRLSRELHDGIGGMLAALKLKINHLKKTNTDPDLLRQIYDITNMLKDTSAEVRTTAHNLLPDILTRLPLSEAVAHFVHSINQSGNIRVQLHIPYSLSGMDKSVELILYRIIQELVQNVIKHAEATHIEVQIMEYQGVLSLTIEDDGIGFDSKTEGGYGLENLKFRVQGLQGEIDIDTAPGVNTTVRIAFNVESLLSIAHNTNENRIMYD